MTKLIETFAGHPNFEAYRLIEQDFHDQHLFIFDNELQASVITLSYNYGFELMVRDWTGEIVMTDEVLNCDDTVIAGLSEQEVLELLSVVSNYKREVQI
ncbi:hypothetical protein [Macrococcus brunensis]|uniref:hypothetical protein n=1 Tax=Macrococcus brunensis TaxID=198483 RepID=UPI001EF0CAA2|nr:hypothetical protein [Macrococcus brunensis]ULG72991.1 hypothetical protein MGG12_05600 [Macrococcus brunensis]